jgi:hypothetical protein
MMQAPLGRMKLPTKYTPAGAPWRYKGTQKYGALRAVKAVSYCEQALAAIGIALRFSKSTGVLQVAN